MKNGKQVTFWLPESEARQLVNLAIQECRRPNAQAKYLVRQSLGIADNAGQSNNPSSVTVAEVAEQPVTTPQ